MIVVAVLGILAAIALPEFQSHIQQAKEAAAKDNLRILRTAIERYAMDNGAPPGYVNNNPTGLPSGALVIVQLTPEYLSEIPVNPVNSLSTMMTIPNATAFPAVPDNSTGWIYKPSTKTIKLNSPGSDSQGANYFDF